MGNLVGKGSCQFPYQPRSTYMGAVTLKRYDVDEELFDKILKDYSFFIKVVSKAEMEASFKGYKYKTVFKYDGIEYLILQELYLDGYLPSISESSWRPVILRRVHNPKINSVEDSIDGTRAYNYMVSLLRRVYTDDEIDECLKAHEAEYSEEKAQYHYQEQPYFDGIIVEHENCYKYDINGAHQSALIEIFPKAKKYIEELYTKRKEKPVYKAYINYYVGMLKRKGHAKTYNWIVQRISKQLLDAIKFTGGDLHYANTDGFIVSNPKNLINASTNLGEFKLEYHGTIYIYEDKNYWCYQTEDGDITGSIRKQVRNLIDLKNNKVVHYDIKRVSYGDVILEELENIEIEII